MNVRNYLTATVLCFGSLGANVRGATVIIPASEDTTLFELGPTSNLGASQLGAGAIAQINSATGIPYRMRALMLFDLEAIPAGAKVTSAEVTVTVVRVPPSIDSTGSMFELHRVLKAWGEGTKGGTIGAPATTGEATWLAPKHPSPEWTAVGASDESDVSAIVSASIGMDALGAYTFASTPTMVSDLQGWINDPFSNFGWMMKSAAETLLQSARRFANRESASGQPTLTVTYDLPATELRIQQFELRQAGMFLSWIGGAAPFRIERANNIAGPWAAVTDPTTEMQATAPSGEAIAFYRVVSVAP